MYLEEFHHPTMCWCSFIDGHTLTDLVELCRAEQRNATP